MTLLDQDAQTAIRSAYEALIEAREATEVARKALDKAQAAEREREAILAQELAVAGAKVVVIVDDEAHLERVDALTVRVTNVPIVRSQR